MIDSSPIPTVGFTGGSLGVRKATILPGQVRGEFWRSRTIHSRGVRGTAAYIRSSGGAEKGARHRLADPLMSRLRVDHAVCRPVRFGTDEHHAR